MVTAAAAVTVGGGGGGDSGGGAMAMARAPARARATVAVGPKAGWRWGRRYGVVRRCAALSAKSPDACGLAGNFRRARDFPANSARQRAQSTH